MMVGYSSKLAENPHRSPFFRWFINSGGKRHGLSIEVDFGVGTLVARSCKVSVFSQESTLAHALIGFCTFGGGNGFTGLQAGAAFTGSQALIDFKTPEPASALSIAPLASNAEAIASTIEKLLRFIKHLPCKWRQPTNSPPVLSLVTRQLSNSEMQLSCQMRICKAKCMIAKDASRMAVVR